MDAIPSSAVIRPSTRQVSCDLTGEVAILNLDSGVYYGLDGVGARIWALISQPRRVSEVRDALVDEFDVDRERCERDLQSLLARLVEAGLIEVENG